MQAKEKTVDWVDLNFELRVYPDSVLRDFCEKIMTFDKKLETCADRMFRFMREQNGIGLAAPQIGLLRRIVTVDVDGVEPIMVNPVILATSVSEAHATEGCLSLPDQWYDVKRWYSIEIKAQNIHGKELKFKLKGLGARVLQHEIDHLNGYLICDRGVRREAPDNS